MYWGLATSLHGVNGVIANVEILSKLEVSPDVAIIMLHPEETYSYPRTMLSLSASYIYCAANWNVTEGTI